MKIISHRETSEDRSLTKKIDLVILTALLVRGTTLKLMFVISMEDCGWDMTGPNTKWTTIG